MKINEKNYNSYNELLDDLKPDGMIGKQQDRFIYRGQGRDWPLLPSIFRKENRHILYAFPNPYIFDRENDIESAYRYTEYELLKNFFKYANNSGIKLPPNIFESSDYILKYNYTNLVKTCRVSWPMDRLTELTALAQHYGIYTRFLDWSFDINVALYFAVKKAVEDIVENKTVDTEKYFVIWMLASEKLCIKLTCGQALPLKFVVPNYYENPNIRAQKGVLTYWETPYTPDFVNTHACLQPLNEALADIEDKNTSVTSTDPTEVFDEYVMHKLTMPITESITIMEHLSKNNYNAAGIFPGYYGAAQQIKEDLLLNEAKLLLDTNPENLFNCCIIPF